MAFVAAILFESIYFERYFPNFYNFARIYLFNIASKRSFGIFIIASND